MTYSLSFRPRALREIREAHARYERVEHGDAFVGEVQAVLTKILAMPRRFPHVHGDVQRALLRRYPFAVFFRSRPSIGEVVVIAVLPQRGDPARRPRR